MKRFIIATIVAVLALVSCEKDTSEAIIGTWEATTAEMTIEGIVLTVDVKEMGMQMTFVFRDNGMGTLTETSEGESYTEDFNYSVSGGMLNVDSDGEVASIPISIDGKKMTLTFDGEMVDEPGMKVKMNFTKK